MTPGTIAWTALVLYLAIGMLLGLRDVKAVLRAVPEALCSDACRTWHEQALEPAQVMSAHPVVAPLALLISAPLWPWALKNRCGCFRSTKEHT